MKITREGLERLYWQEEKTQKRIATELECSCSTIKNWMIKFGVKRRTPGARAKVNLPHEELERMYWKDNMSMKKIGDELGYDSETIRRCMARRGIPRRSQGEYQLIEPNTNPSQDLAYILGVLKGDGDVYFPKDVHTGRIRLRQIRAEFAHSFENALKMIGLHPRTYIEKPRKTMFTNYPQPIFLTLAHSFKFAQFYKRLSFEDIEKLLGNNLKFVKEFVRGFFESEGMNCINPRRESKAIKWQICIAGRDKELYDLFERLLIKLGFNFKRHCYNQCGGYSHVKKPLYSLHSTDQHRNYRFIKEIAPCIKNRTIEPCSRVERDWTKEEVIEELKNFVRFNGFSPSAKDVPDTLRGATERLFGSWNEAKTTAGIEVYPVGYNLNAKTGLKPVKGIGG